MMMHHTTPVTLHPSTTLNVNSNIIKDNASLRDANVFCFDAFADKCTGMLYNDLTSLFPFMSLESNICILIVYNYETHAIMALPISEFSNQIVFVAYKQQYELLSSKGHIIKLNVMDNQASKSSNIFSLHSIAS